MKKHFTLYWPFLIVFGLFFISCKKDSFISSPDAKLIISVDSLKFDTVFTSTGSITKVFKLINDNDQRLRLSKIKLLGGPASAYKMNIDGTSTTEMSDLEIAANDSIYIFVSVNINPNAANLPFIVSDSILISYNGNTHFVHLEAFGQNANFLRNRVITGNITWNSTLPFVILGSIRVDTTATLTIKAGTHIYSHANAPFIVDGTVIITGTRANNVVFAGDRLDPDYKDLPAGWPGLYFRGSSKNNVMKFAVIKNANQAIVLDQPSPNLNPKLVMHQCIIDNAWDAGILSVNSSLQADNCLVSNCGSNIALTYGGNYTLTHCTVAAYSTNLITHRNPVLAVNNFLVQGTGFLTANLNAVFRNCIFWGDGGFISDEVTISKQGASSFSVVFDKNLYRVATDPANSTLTGNIKNADPSFDSIDVFKRIFNFRITKNPSAPGIDKGSPTAFPRDLDDNNRNVGPPDIGCYEKQ